MMRYAVLIVSICGLLPLSGCYGLMGCGPCGAPACGPCDAACGVPVAGCGAACGVVGAACDPCGSPCDDGPIRWAWRMLGLGCADGCGEKYYGDWCTDPPDCHDPCDCYGNYVGGCSSGACDSAGPEAISIDDWAQNRPAAGSPQIVGSPKIISESEQVAQPPAARPAARVVRTNRAGSQSRPLPIRR